MSEEWSEKWNPFNSDKLIAHVYRWSKIEKGKPIPNPILVTIDPTDVCNLKCIWCNSEYIQKYNSSSMTKETLLKIADFLSEWKVEAVCVAGGGEPLLNQNTSFFIDRCIENGIKVGVVTNGFFIDKHLDSLSKCDWVGVSIDAGTPETYTKLKGVNVFNKVINNMKLLINYKKESNLMKEGQGYGVTYKFLLHPFNVEDVYKATKIANEIGCKNMHIRPFGEPWDKLGKIEDKFTYSDIQEFKEQLTKARILENKKFRVFGITHKFNGDFRKKNEFKECHAIFMTGVFMPPSGTGNFDYGFCCDRRGDKKLTLYNLKEPNEIKKIWGSKKHWEIFNEIKVNKCPRCTYQPHNIIFEKVIKENNTTYQFI